MIVSRRALVRKLAEEGFVSDSNEPFLYEKDGNFVFFDDQAEVVDTDLIVATIGVVYPAFAKHLAELFSALEG